MDARHVLGCYVGVLYPISVDDLVVAELSKASAGRGAMIRSLSAGIEVQAVQCPEFRSMASWPDCDRVISQAGGDISQYLAEFFRDGTTLDMLNTESHVS